MSEVSDIKIVDEDLADANLQYKELGNKALHNGDFSIAIEYYTKGIENKKHPTHIHILLSNRSQAHIANKDFESALKDAQTLVDIQPNWGKSYYRLGNALMKLNRLEEAYDAFKLGEKNDPDNLFNFPQLIKEFLQSVAKKSDITGDDEIKIMIQDQVQKITNAESELQTLLKGLFKKQDEVYKYYDVLNMYEDQIKQPRTKLNYDQYGNTDITGNYIKPQPQQPYYGQNSVGNLNMNNLFQQFQQPQQPNTNPSSTGIFNNIYQPPPPPGTAGTQPPLPQQAYDPNYLLNQIRQDIALTQSDIQNMQSSGNVDPILMKQLQDDLVRFQAEEQQELQYLANGQQPPPPPNMNYPPPPNMNYPPPPPGSGQPGTDCKTQ